MAKGKARGATTCDARCPVCTGTDLERLFDAPDRLELSSERFDVWRCRACGTGVTLPTATEAELARFYPDEYWGESADPDDAWIARTQREKTSFVERYGPSGGALLDVGCGAGFFLRALDAGRWDRFGVEISPRSAAAAERHLGAGRVFAGRFVDAPFPAGRFDCITFWASLEHVVDARADLRHARRLVRDGGSIVVQVPNFASYQSKRFGADWFSLDVPRHRTHFTPESLGRLVAEAGFEVSAVHGRSETHDPHALKQSLKSRLVRRPAPLGRPRYYLAAPFLGLVDRIAGGATITLAARTRPDPPASLRESDVR